QVPPLNAYLPIDLLQSKIGLEGKANVLLVGARNGKPLASNEATTALWSRWQFSDAGLELRELPAVAQSPQARIDPNSPSIAARSPEGLQGRSPTLELRTDRVFLDPPVGQAAMTAAPNAQGVLTYF